MITEEGNSCENRYEVQDKPRFKRSSSNERSSNAPKLNKSKVTTPKPQEGKGGRSYVEKPLCAKCYKRHDGKFLVSTGNLYDCVKSCHMKRHFPIMMSHGKENSQTQASAPKSDAPKKNRLYALQFRSD